VRSRSARYVKGRYFVITTGIFEHLGQEALSDCRMNFTFKLFSMFYTAIFAHDVKEISQYPTNCGKFNLENKIRNID
jgi:hypothetical protein